MGGVLSPVADPILERPAMRDGFDVKLISSLEKVFADEPLRAKPFTQASALAGEVFSFQVAIQCAKHRLKADVEVLSPLKERITVRRVGLVPVEFGTWRTDDHYLRGKPGLYPDVLIEREREFRPLANVWHAYWVTVRVPEDHPGGQVPVQLRFSLKNAEPYAPFEAQVDSPVFTLRVIPERLPAQELINTQWFHADCISTHHDCKVWSARYWALLERYFRNAVAHGQNMMLTPMFTPPLDTQVGGERPTVQLVDVACEGGRYTFNLKRLDRWIDLALKCGIQYLEMSHLFSQWGAKYAPKIMVKEKGTLVQKFGWHVRGDSPAYRKFLKAYLPVLTAHLKKRGIADRCFFHISDEPSKDMIDDFAKAVAIVKPLLEGFKIIDALSDMAFYQSGLITHPIPGSDHIEPFTQADLPERWTYYCCAQMVDVANRFICMPSARNRILGLQLYVYGIDGFLHWGYNFWYSQYSIEKIDPYKVTDAGHGFQAGDAFVVYPGPEGPLDSLRHEVFHDAIQDLRALKLLERFIGREAVLGIIEKKAGKVTMKSYPRKASWLLAFREHVNAQIQKHGG